MYSNLNLPKHMKHGEFKAVLKQEDVAINAHDYSSNSGDYFERVDFQLNGVPFRAVMHKYTGGKWLIKQRSLMPNQIESLPTLRSEVITLRHIKGGDKR